MQELDVETSLACRSRRLTDSMTHVLTIVSLQDQNNTVVHNFLLLTSSLGGGMTHSVSMEKLISRFSRIHLFVKLIDRLLTKGCSFVRSSLNMEAFRKILKKFEKVMQHLTLWPLMRSFNR